MFWRCTEDPTNQQLIRAYLSLHPSSTCVHARHPQKRENHIHVKVKLCFKKLLQSINNIGCPTKFPTSNVLNFIRLLLLALLYLIYQILVYKKITSKVVNVGR